MNETLARFLPLMLAGMVLIGIGVVLHALISTPVTYIVLAVGIIFELVFCSAAIASRGKPAK